MDDSPLILNEVPLYGMSENPEIERSYILEGRIFDMLYNKYTDSTHFPFRFINHTLRNKYMKKNIDCWLKLLSVTQDYCLLNQVYCLMNPSS